ncbi:MAG: ABC transporter ATP-binding protein [Christensenellales bacterium]
MDKVLEVENLSKKYKGNDYYSVKGVSFDCYLGEVVGMVGKNGAGKSTIIKCITGLIPYSEGAIKVLGKEVKDNATERKRNIGFVPDVSFAFEKMAGIEYVNFVADIYGVSQDDRIARLNEFEGKFNLGDKIYNLISSYSHGMKQKISVMASLISYPKLWILDEPHTGLDPQTTLALRNYMKDYASKGNCVIFSSHNLDIVQKICDKVIIINNGEVVAKVDMAEFAKSGQSLEEYFIEMCGD